jgi:hypothetical protein
MDTSRTGSCQCGDIIYGDDDTGLGLAKVPAYREAT